MYYALGLLNVETAAFDQLTRKYMQEEFNPKTPDINDVRYMDSAILTQESSKQG